MSRLALPDARGARAPGCCRRCGQALSALARRRGDLCDAMDCRRLAADELARARRAVAMDNVRAAAARAWSDPALAAAPVVWLRHHAEGFEPPDPAEVAELRACLLALEDDDRPPAPAADDAARDPPSSPMDGPLCALCRGRCCHFGLRGHAFLEPRDLRGWLDGHPGAAWADAVDHYLAHVPAEHLESSCLFHGARGCTLPRERRSDVCNRFACDELAQLRRLAAARPEAVAAVGIVASQELRGAALVSAQGSRALPVGDGYSP